ncbi:hypothetical protein AAEO56_06390 [Flavobacterium sp. DGU11]|uniref:Uncharacterized protein n=1 Tax=Flavobacterium arundinis TaxID=3139143 RepID=A0ABU9HUQ8_9FLAO
MGARPTANAAGVSPMLLLGGRIRFKTQKGVPDRKGGIAFLRRGTEQSANR